MSTTMNDSHGDTHTIMHIAPTPFFSDRGCHIRIAGIVRCLQKLDLNNIVCTYHLGKDVKGILTHRIGDIKNYRKTSAGPSKYKPWADLKLLFVALEQCRQTRPAAIHAHLHEGILIALLVKSVYFWRRIPIIADLQGSLVGELETYGSFRKYPLFRMPIAIVERVLLYFSSHIVCSSQHALDIMTDRFPESAHKTSLAQDGADEPQDTKPDSSELRKKLNIDPDAVCIVYTGVLQESKGLDELKEIIRQTKDSQRKIHFLIVGYPTDDLSRFLDEHQLRSMCTLTGQTEFDELSNYLSLGNIALDPKNSDAGEGSGKILNYMAHAKAIIAFNTTNNRKFLGSEAHLSNTVAEAFENMLSYVDDESKARSAGQEHYERFKRCYSWQVCASQLETVYREFLPAHFEQGEQTSSL